MITRSRLLYAAPAVLVPSLAMTFTSQQIVALFWGSVAALAVVGYVVLASIKAWRSGTTIQAVHQGLTAHDQWERAERETAITMFATVQAQHAAIVRLLERIEDRLPRGEG